MVSAERAAALRKGCECFHSWHKYEVQRCPLFGRSQGKNERRADIAFL
jgi:hypothetical protein